MNEMKQDKISGTPTEVDEETVAAARRSPPTRSPRSVAGFGPR